MKSPGKLSHLQITVAGESMRILVVEDHERLGSTLRDTLVHNKYAVDWVVDGEAGLFHGREYEYDLAIIDLGLPKMDGVSLIKELRSMGKEFPILILTARSNWQDKVLGLESGADDYLVKPFINEELLARLNALLRRSAGMASPEITLGSLTLNTSEKASGAGRFEKSSVIFFNGFAGPSAAACSPSSTTARRSATSASLRIVASSALTPSSISCRKRPLVRARAPETSDGASLSS